MSLEMSGLGLKVLNNPHKLPWHNFVGALGITGQMAYYGLKDLSSPKPIKCFTIEIFPDSDRY